MSKRLPQPRMKQRVVISGSDFLDVCQYDFKTQTLDIQLQNGKAYRYRGIGAATFTKLLTSASPGKVYNERIKVQLKGFNGNFPVHAPRKVTRLKRNLWYKL